MTQYSNSAFDSLLALPKEKKESVTIQLQDGRTQIINLHESFSLNKSSMTNDKVRGYDTFPQRMADITSTINGPTSGGVRLAQVARLTLVSTAEQVADDFGSGFLKSFERAYQDYSK